MKYGTHEKTKDFIENMFAGGFLPLITKPTRITSHSATLIDHIYSNNSRCNYTSGIVVSDVADHFAVFTILTFFKHENKPKYIEKRIFNAENLCHFQSLLDNSDYSQVLNCNCPNLAYDLFMDIFKKAMDTACPLKRIKINKKHMKREPWFTQGLLISYRRKEKLLHTKLRKPTEDNVNIYKNYCRLYTKVVRTAKRLFYGEKFMEIKNDTKQTWNLIQKIVKKKGNATKSSDSFVVDQEEISDPKQIAEAFNGFFSKIGLNISNNVPNSNKHYSHFLPKLNCDKTIFLDPISPDEVIKACSQLKPKSSSGCDDISSKILKQTIENIVIPLTYIFNLSLENGIVPNKMKISKVIPLFKSGDRKLLNNYRPISLLPAISKLLEKLMYKKIISFFNANNLLYKHQYGFRAKHSTIHPILHLLQSIAVNNDKATKDLTLAVFLDLSKAFDCISHEILLDKLYLYGIRGVALDWLKSYLTGRNQFVSFNGQNSTLLPLLCGVPQGSILGPLLFLIYINDICHATNLNLLSFADDTTIYASGPNVDQLSANVSHELAKLYEWFNANKLLLNAKKSNCTLFKPKHNKSNLKECPLILNDDIICEDTAKFLGIYLDESLSWDKHISVIRAKISGAIFTINKVKHFLPHNVLKTLYFSLIHSQLSYGLLAWGNASGVNKIFKLQKRAVRVINNTYFLAHTEPIFKREKILKLNDLYKLSVALFMQDYLTNKLPQSFRNFFHINNTKYTCTRQNNHIYRTRPRTAYSANLPAHNFPIIWNSLNLTCQQSRSALKKSLTTKFLDCYPPTITCLNKVCKSCQQT